MSTATVVKDVELFGGPPWGFRLGAFTTATTGDGQLLPGIKIARVNPGSKASISGLRDGDLILSVNGENVHASTSTTTTTTLEGQTEGSPTSHLQSQQQHSNIIQQLQNDNVKLAVFSKKSKSKKKDKDKDKNRESPGSKKLTLRWADDEEYLNLKTTKNTSGDGDGGGGDSMMTSITNDGNIHNDPILRIEEDFEKDVKTKANGDVILPPLLADIIDELQTAATTAAELLAETNHTKDTSRGGTRKELEMQGGGLLRQVSNGPGSTMTSSVPIIPSSLLIKKEDLEKNQKTTTEEDEEAIPPVWTPPGVPPSPNSQRKFRPVHFSASSSVPNSPSLPTNAHMPLQNDNFGVPNASPSFQQQQQTAPSPIVSLVSSPSPQPQQPLQLSTHQQYFQHQQSKFQSMATSNSASTTTNGSHNSTTPVTPTVNSNVSNLPRYQSPTVTLLQKAREGQLPKGAAYLEQQQEVQSQDKQTTLVSNNISQQTQHTTINSNISNEIHPVQFNPALAIRSYSNNVIPPNHQLSRSRSAQMPSESVDIPLTSKYSLSGEKEQREWYRKMYESLHVEKKREIANQKCTYPAGKIKAGQPVKSFWAKQMHSSGAQSEPEDELSYFGQAEEEEYDFNKFGNKILSPDSPASKTIPAGAIRFNNPGRIEDYNPTAGTQTSNARKQRYFRQMQPDLKKHWALSSPISSGYESDSNYIIRKRSEGLKSPGDVGDEPPPPPMSPEKQRQVYLDIQKGGEVPFQGLRKLIGPHYNHHEDEFRTLSPSQNLRYSESTVNIHYRAPVRIEEKEFVAEDELRRRQQQQMKKFYEEQRKLKYMREVEDMERRRHSDNFVPSQKSPIPLNRYEDGEDYDGLVDNRPPRPNSGGLWQRMTPEPTPTGRTAGTSVSSKSLNLFARVLHNFMAQSPRELELVKGDLVFVRRKIDNNWYEGELRSGTSYSSISTSALGIFPCSYVQVLSDSSATKPPPPAQSEGLARVLYNFRPSIPLEIELTKGEMVILTRRIDSNWFEGRRQMRSSPTGIFPVSYVEVVKEIGASSNLKSPKPIGQPVAHSLNYGQADRHHYKPNEFVLQDESSDYGDVFSPGPKSPAPAPGNKNDRNRRKMNQRLELITIDTRLNNDQPFRYRAIYNYKPVHTDELELGEDDIIEVLERCDDGWFVGTSTRTGLFGTFPGNYVERIN